MKSLYLLINIASISIPFLFSFHPKLKFYKLWKPLIIAICLSTSVYISWDIPFTVQGIWGFNEAYLTELYVFHLPIEEWLFFVCIPYACVFTHYALLYYFPNLGVTKQIARILSLLLLIIFMVLAMSNYDKSYTFINFGLATLILIYALWKHSALLQDYYITFLAILIPFFIVNGILTGSFIENEVVWYNNAENLGIRLFTIPIEDSIYAFSLILLNLIIIKEQTNYPNLK